MWRAIIRFMLPQASALATELARRLSAFMTEHVYPSERLLHAQVAEGDRWQPVPLVETLKDAGAR